MIIQVSVVPRTVWDDIDQRFDNMSGISHHQNQVNLWNISIYYKYLWLLTWFVNKVQMLLAICQLSHNAIGCEDCKKWLVHFVLSVSQKSISLYNTARMLPYLIACYWHHHGTFLNIRTAMRPSADILCKSDREARALTKRQYQEPIKKCMFIRTCPSLTRL